ncbi:Conserved_hypothetical protein [Hexamita inflata]|uniref:LisH domain-containing protein n=1 Tax=Hexamita inflata TaxID=28002 RepID=A0AA86U0T9_9EUKA|nr:Conserved hypothetical protein [Hexamita inflata]
MNYDQFLSNQMTYSELNKLVLDYLKECGYKRTAEQFVHEAAVAPISGSQSFAFRRLVEKGLYYAKFASKLTPVDSVPLPSAELQISAEVKKFNVQSVLKMEVVKFNNQFMIIILSENKVKFFELQNNALIQFETVFEDAIEFKVLEFHAYIQTNELLKIVDLRTLETTNQIAIHNQSKFFLTTDAVVINELVLTPDLQFSRFRAQALIDGEIFYPPHADLSDYFEIVVLADRSTMKLISKTQQELVIFNQNPIQTIFYPSQAYFYVIEELQIHRYQVECVQTTENGANSSNKMFVRMAWSLSIPAKNKVFCQVGEFSIIDQFVINQDGEIIDRIDAGAIQIEKNGTGIIALYSDYLLLVRETRYKIQLQNIKAIGMKFAGEQIVVAGEQGEIQLISYN